jgi:hypothetical protein
MALIHIGSEILKQPYSNFVLFLLLFCGCVQHGWMLVSHALAYVTASKNGVSEPEIEDFISLDDKVGF